MDNVIAEFLEAQYEAFVALASAQGYSEDECNQAIDRLREE